MSSWNTGPIWTIFHIAKIFSKRKYDIRTQKANAKSTFSKRIDWKRALLLFHEDNVSICNKYMFYVLDCVQTTLYTGRSLSVTITNIVKHTVVRLEHLPFSVTNLSFQVCLKLNCVLRRSPIQMLAKFCVDLL